SWRRGGVGVGVSFFFQAEDGIRDRTVTGVQTCALPILRSWWRSSVNGHQMSRIATMTVVICMMRRALPLDSGTPLMLLHQKYTRSEERRVGKECRSRWLWIH